MAEEVTLQIPYNLATRDQSRATLAVGPAGIQPAVAQIVKQLLGRTEMLLQQHLATGAVLVATPLAESKESDPRHFRGVATTLVGTHRQQQVVTDNRRTENLTKYLHTAPADRQLRR